MTTPPLPVAFSDARADQFPINLYAFGPDQDFVFRVEVPEAYTMVPVPGSGPGSVRYMVIVFADGTAVLRDDPTCSETLPPGAV